MLNHSSGINMNNVNNKVIIDIIVLSALFTVIFSGLKLVIFLFELTFSALGSRSP